MVDMTLKELIKYENMLCSLQQEYEGKLSKIYEGNSSDNKERLTIVLNLIIEERQKVNRQKYKPVEN